MPLELSMLVQDSEELQKEIGWELEELRAQLLSPKQVSQQIRENMCNTWCPAPTSKY